MNREIRWAAPASQGSLLPDAKAKGGGLNHGNRSASRARSSVSPDAEAKEGERGGASREIWWVLPLRFIAGD